MAARRFSVSRRCLNKTDNKLRFIVTFVWGAHDPTPRSFQTYDRAQAFRYAKDRAAQGAPIVIVKRNTRQGKRRLVADFSTVGGAA
jgi:hypothetical protein